ncbi:bacteriophage abortive infection AbiH family protein [Peribacillus frigoritolerans]|uniref:bacteriophage abortive infection AbiH family protein n=1 Tax=Peribacillus frigoritolerans TaxID=450367 RepID=UPI0024C1A9D5|nr:bacteriophage abortive infection AbiH family protein [Peribacillus frigoritolerans]WHX59890.1 bacteriophage abortive infection AbiH family protein [Peribacillus frigoritolerans]
MNKLFIIGNGFDGSHGLETSYDHFRKYLLSNNPEIKMDEFIVPTEIYEPGGGVSYRESEVLSMLFYLINEVESCTKEWTGEWNNIESSLGYLSFDEAFDWLDDICDKDGDINYFKTANRNEDIASQLVIPTTSIQHLFTEWINTINLDSVETKRDFQKLVNDQGCFLTFNYTETLEEVYGIQEDSICHIHGKQNEEIFFGHGNFEDYTERYMQKHIGSQDSLSKINRQLRKRTDKALDNNSDFFYSLEKAGIKKIYSYGFSFSKVDMVYLKKICNQINTKNSIWYFNDFDVSNHNKFKDVLRKCGYKGSFNTFHITK